MNPVISSFVFPILCSPCPTVASHMFSFTITNPVLLSLILCSALIHFFYLSFLSRTLLLFLFLPYNASLLALLSLPICFPLLSQILYFYFSVFCSALIRSSYLSFHFSIKGCAWFPSRVQQFLCQMTQSWHHASALHCVLHCSALVWDCLGFYIDI